MAATNASVRAVPTSVMLLMTTALATQAVAQTTEERLRRCVESRINEYQPVSSYAETFKCRTGNKKPARSTPASGPNPITYSVNGYIILTAAGRQLWNFHGGGFGPPYITPDKREVRTSIWCKAENKDFGGGGSYGFELSGTKQRVATRLEYRRVLSQCSREVNLFI